MFLILAANEALDRLVVIQNGGAAGGDAVEQDDRREAVRRQRRADLDGTLAGQIDHDAVAIAASSPLRTLLFKASSNAPSAVSGSDCPLMLAKWANVWLANSTGLVQSDHSWKTRDAIEIQIQT